MQERGPARSWSARLRGPAGLVNLAVIACLAIATVEGWRGWFGPWRTASAASREPALTELRELTIERMARFGVELTLTELRASDPLLRWRAPTGECIEIYEVRIDERFRDASVASFVGRSEEHVSQYLGLAADPRRRASDGVEPVLGLLLSDPSEEPRVRELWWGRARVGPSAPDFACRRRSWDPLEDALALGWPRLPTGGSWTRWTRGVWVGERWTGEPVEGRCHETTCVNPDGSFDHQSPCRARSWSERLVGVEGGLALISGDWDDGHDPARPELGIRTSRELVLDEGRPLYVHAVIEQRWVGVRREISLVRLDDCGARRLVGTNDGDERAARFREQIHARLSPHPRR